MALNPPVQARSRRTLQRLASATMELLEERGGTEFSVNDVVRRARSSVGSFYARFSSKDELLAYVGSRMWKDAVERWDEARTSSDWPDLPLETLIRGLTGVFDDSEGMHLRARSALGPAFHQGDAEELRGHIEEGAVELLLLHRREIGHGDPEAAARFAIRLIQAAIRDPAAVRVDPELHGEDLDRLSMAITAYLTGSLDTGEGEGDVDFFEVWG